MTDCEHNWAFQYVCYWGHQESDLAKIHPRIRDKYYCTKCLDLEYSQSRKYIHPIPNTFVWEPPI